jgi:hypothetical protein
MDDSTPRVQQVCLWSRDVRETEDFIEVLNKLLHDVHEKTNVMQRSLKNSEITLDELHAALKMMPK